MAVGQVTITLRARGDLSHESEYLTIDINGVEVGTAFKTDGSDCSGERDRAAIEVPAEVFNDAAAGYDVVITVTASETVDPELCDPSSVIVGLSYEIADCNANGVGRLTNSTSHPIRTRPTPSVPPPLRR